MVMDCERARQLATVVENTFEAIALLDLGKENLLRYVNPAWEKLFGYRSSEVVDRLEGLIPEAARREAGVEKKLADAVQRGTPFSAEMEWKHKDGTRVPIEARRQELHALHNRFIRIVSHQLRTPLNVVRWHLEALLDEQLGPLAIAHKDSLRTIYDANQEVLRRIHDLLIVLDIENGRLGTVVRQEILLEALWTTVLAAYQYLSELQKLKVHVELPPQPLPALEGDPEKIRSVIEQLFDNAISYTPPGGTVTVRMTFHSPFVRFAVTDTGIGIPKAEQENIFQRFYRASNASGMQSHSSGVGLYIAKETLKNLLRPLHRHASNYSAALGDTFLCLFSVHACSLLRWLRSFSEVPKVFCRAAQRPHRL